MSRSWDQSGVFEALVARGEYTNKGALNPYVQLYGPQLQNAALLYQGSPKAPIHLNHRQWSCESWERIRNCLPYLTWVHRDQSKKTVFDHYRVDDWDAFANVLKLIRK